MSNDFLSTYLYGFINLSLLPAKIDATTVNERTRKILDYASDSTSEDESPHGLDNTWPNHEMDNSDCESYDSEGEDPLR